MPAQTPLLVSKPQVQFSERLTDSHLSRLTVAQLRKKARDKKLNVSLLTEKWEFVHVLVLEDMCGMESFVQHTTDTKRRTIFYLPGEIRNKIYGNILIQDQPIVGLYQYRSSSTCTSSFSSLRAYIPNIIDAFTRRPETPAEKSCREQEPLITDLRNMSWASRELRREVRDFFFRHNVFQVIGNTASAYSNFLDDIGTDGRANLVSLKLSGSRYCTYKESFSSMLRTCVNLRHLAMRSYISQLLDRESYAFLARYMEVKPQIWDDDVVAVEFEGGIIDMYKTICQLPSLETLDNRTVLPKGWSLAHFKRLTMSMSAPKGQTPAGLLAQLQLKGVKLTSSSATGN